MEKYKIIGNSKDMPIEKWRELRKDYIGGSDSSVVLGLNPYKTANELFYEKIRCPINEFKGNIATKVGNLLENLVAEIFADKTGFKLIEDTNIYQSIENPFMMANLDYMVEDHQGNRALLECKTSSYFKGDAWKKGVPIEYEVQCRHYMAIMGIDVCYIACLYDNNDNSFIYHIIERDLKMEKIIIENERLFWEYHVKNCIEPELDIFAIEKNKKFIEQFYKAQKGKTITLGEESIEIVKNYLDIKKQREEIEKEHKKSIGILKDTEEQLKVEILKSLKGCEVGIVGGYEISNKTSESPTIKKSNLGKLELEYPDVFKKYATVSTRSSFNIKEKKDK